MSAHDLDRQAAAGLIALALLVFVVVVMVGIALLAFGSGIAGLIHTLEALPR